MRIFIAILAGFIILASCNKPRGENEGSAPQRIISLAPHVTETIYALGLQDRLIAVTDFCRYPEEAVQKEHIGGLLNPNLEKIIALQPQVLIGTPAHADLAENLSSYGYRFVLLPNDSKEDIFRLIDSMGTVLHCPDRASHLLRSMSDSLARYQKQASLLNTDIPLRAMLVIGREPGNTRGVTVAGPETFINSMWELVGGKNIFDDLPAPYAPITREAILAKMPEIIIEFKFNENWSEEKDQANRKEWEALNFIPAVRQNRIIVLTGNYTLIPGPRLHLLAADFYRIVRSLSKKNQQDIITE